MGTEPPGHRATKHSIAFPAANPCATASKADSGTPATSATLLAFVPRALRPEP